MSDGYWFKSSLFEIEPGEDDEINPGIYGRQLTQWLKARLEAGGYAVEAVIAEDWGRCLMCQRSPFSLWVGVSSVDDETRAAGEIPTKEAVIWHCFATTEGGLRMRMFGKKNEIEASRAKLDATLLSILRSEPAINGVTPHFPEMGSDPKS
jgi:hypothetical protein